MRALLLLALVPTLAFADDELVDMDGDGDIDADDRVLLDAAAETIEIVDKSDATKLEESSRAVTVIDLAADRERSADLGEVLSRTRGIQVRREGGLGSTTRFSLNGLVDDQIRFFLDGVPIDLAGGNLGIADFPTDLIARVDVYRGVVPIALGADALGGAIDMITDPTWASHATVGYQVGSFGTHRAAIGGRARDLASGAVLGINVFGDRARNNYEIDVEVADERGRVSNARVERFHDRYTAGGAIVEGGVVQRGALDRAIIRAFATQSTKQLQHNVVMTVPYGEVEYGTVNRGASLDIAAHTGGWKARLVGGYTHLATDFIDISTNVYDWRGTITGTRTFGGELGEATHQTLREHGAFARAVVERVFGAHTLRVAIAPTAYLRGGTDYLDRNKNGRDPIEAQRDVLQTVAGVEHELRTERIENTAFAKYYLLATEVEHVGVGYTFTPQSTRLHHLGLGDSARLHLREGMYLKASYEWATRLPTPDELFGDGVLVQENLELRPERSHNANLAVHVEGTSRFGAWGSEVAGFARLADDLIVLIGNDRTQKNHNVYGAHVLGVEGMVGYTAPHEWLSAELNVTVQDIRNNSPEGPFGQFDGDRIPNRPWLLGSLQLTSSRRDVLQARDQVTLFATSRYVHTFFRGWESLGAREYKQSIPSQLIHGAGITYAVRAASELAATLEVQNLTSAAAFDSFGVQKPGRAFFLKLSAEI